MTLNFNDSLKKEDTIERQARKENRKARDQDRKIIIWDVRPVLLNWGTLLILRQRIYLILSQAKIIILMRLNPPLFYRLCLRV
jgi:hypothetical protein